MKIQFAGCGSLFSSTEQFQSNMIVTADSGARMLVDCGADARHSLSALGVTPADLELIFISHLHMDHIGGLEWLAFATYFDPAVERPLLYADHETLADLWPRSLRGGLERIGGQDMAMADYFRCRPLGRGERFSWQGIDLRPVAVPHIVSPSGAMLSHGLLMRGAGEDVVYITSDCRFEPEVMGPYYDEATVIFHDCETTAEPTTVHPPYRQLCTLPAAVRRKIWLYHYQDAARIHPEADGFAGVVTRGQEFQLDI